MLMMMCGYNMSMMQMCRLWILVLAVLSIPNVSGLSMRTRSSSQPRNRESSSLSSSLSSSDRIVISRRHALAGVVTVATTTLSPMAPSHATTADSSTATTSNNGLTISDLLQQLQTVPTFCIVNSEGAAYMLVKRNEGMAVGYAFTTLQGALTVLGDARRAAEEGGYDEIWKDATITTIPMDIAMRLALKKQDRFSQKNQSLGTLILPIPGFGDREDAIEMGQSKFGDQGKVPLFYLKELRLSDGSTPVYFTKKDLLVEWNQQHPELRPPNAIQLLDLTDVFQYALRGRSNELPKNLRIVPNQEQVQASREMKKRGLTPYKVDRMVV